MGVSWVEAGLGASDSAVISAGCITLAHRNNDKNTKILESMLFEVVVTECKLIIVVEVVELEKLKDLYNIMKLKVL